MKAIMRDTYGSAQALRLDDIDEPTIKAHEVLVRVRASSVSIGDWFALTGTPALYRLVAGVRRPKVKVLGRDVAGVVEQIGTDVAGLTVGDAVYGEIDFGAHAELVAAPADKITLMPTSLTFEQAAAVPIAGVAALQGLRDAGSLQPGQKVLVNGGSGAVGTFAVQIAKALGAEVTAVCSTRNLELVRSIGADHAIDYTTTDFTTGEERYDLIFDLAASHGLSAYRRVLTGTGVYVAAAADLGLLARTALVGMVTRGQVVAFAAKESRADLDALRGMIEAGQVTPVIERSYALAEVPAAFRDQGAGHAQGRKVIDVAA